DAEREDPVDRQPRRGVLDVVTLDGGRTVGAADRRERPGEGRVSAAVLTDDLLLLGHHLRGTGGRERTDLADRRREVAFLGNRQPAHVDVGPEPAARTTERLGGDVEHELGTALTTRVGAGLFGDLERGAII